MESNILIADFMDLSTEVDGLYLLPNGLCEEELMGLGSMISIDEMLYHKSWSWLMKVVDKIEGFQDGKDGDSIRGHLYNFRIEQICAYIIDGGSSDIIISVDGDNKRDATYNAVVEFIKWHNKKQHES
jgi:hypothetical protein